LEKITKMLNQWQVLSYQKLIKVQFTKKIT
jgi:hypothetical protein